MVSNMATRRRSLFGTPRIHDVDPKEAAGLQEQGAVLLDVREDDEWTAGHAPGALHLPLAGVAGAMARFGGRQVVAVCRGGNRSAQAATALARAGIDVRNVSGGMSAWAAAGLAVVRDDGSTGSVV